MSHNQTNPGTSQEQNKQKSDSKDQLFLEQNYNYNANFASAEELLRNLEYFNKNFNIFDSQNTEATRDDFISQLVNSTQKYSEQCQDSNLFGGTGEVGDLGGLQPLTRPNPNQVPPEVLAVLLKPCQGNDNNTQFQGEMNGIHTNSIGACGGDIGGSPSFSNCSGSTFLKSESVTEPSLQTYQSPRVSTPTTTPRHHDGVDSKSTFTLSPLAREFLPQKPMELNPSTVTQPTTAGSSYENEIVTEEAEVDVILGTLTKAISEITLNPAKFDKCVKRTVDVILMYLNNDVDTLSIMVELIVEQSINFPNFCYSGAKLCEIFNKSGVAAGSQTFKAVLLKMLCQEKHLSILGQIEKFENSANTDGLTQVNGFLHFLAELYMTFKIKTKTKGSAHPLSVFALGLLELMSKISKLPTYENFKSIVHVLKLVGWNLENDPSPMVKRQMEELMKELTYLHSFPKNIKPQTTLLLGTLVEMKKRNWDRSEIEQTDGEENVQLDESSQASSESGSTLEENELDLYEQEDDNLSSERNDQVFLELENEPEGVLDAYEQFAADAMNNKARTA